MQDVNGEQILHQEKQFLNSALFFSLKFRRLQTGFLFFSVLAQEMFVLQERGAEEEHTLNFTVPITEPLPPQQLGTARSGRTLLGTKGIATRNMNS